VVRLAAFSKRPFPPVTASTNPSCTFFRSGYEPRGFESVQIAIKYLAIIACLLTSSDGQGHTFITVLIIIYPQRIRATNVAMPIDSSFRILPRSPSRDRAANEPSHRPRSNSLTSFFRNILPSQRPERGGTHRDHGYWESFNKGSPNDHGLPPSSAGSHQRSDHSEPDKLLRWNTAKSLPRGRPKTSSIEPPRRAVSTNNQPSLTEEARGRRHSFSPHEPRPDKSHRQLAMSQPRERPEHASRLRHPKHPSQQLLEKQESRRQRRTLRQGGDYLGVQGINPDTGELDIVTPSSSSQSVLSLDTQQTLATLAQAATDAKTMYNETITQTEGEIKALLLKRELEKLNKREQKKVEIRDVQRKVKWRNDPRQWSSAQEPDLSPIAQSQRSTTPHSRMFLWKPQYLLHLLTSDLLDTENPPKFSVPNQQQDEVLVRLDSSGPAPADRFLHVRDHGGRQNDLAAASSSETIVHTPMQRESIFASASAMELLENGIRIGQSPEEAHPGSESVHPTEHDEAEAKSNLPNLRAAPAPSGIRKNSPPSIEVTTPGNTRHKEFVPIAMEQEPFLGQGRPGVAGREGSQENRSPKAIHPPERPPRNLMPICTNVAELESSDSVSNHPGQQSSPRVDPTVTVNGKMTSHLKDLISPHGVAEDRSIVARAKTTAKTRLMQPESKNTTYLSDKVTGNRSALIRTSNTSRREKPGGNQSYGGQTTAISSRSKPQISRKPPFIPRKLTPTLNAIPLAKDIVNAHLREQREKSEEVNKDFLLCNPSNHVLRRKIPRWGTRAMRDRTNKGEIATDQSAFTLTTITTGLDGQRPSSRVQVRADGGRHVESARATRRLSRIIHNLPTSSVTEINAKSSLPTQMSSISQKCGHVAEIPAADITSVRQLIPTKERTEKLSSRASICQSPTPKEPKCRSETGNASPTSTSTSQRSQSRSPLSIIKNTAAEDIQLKEAIAQGAARAALLHAGSLMAVPGDKTSSPEILPKAGTEDNGQPSPNADPDRGDIGDHSSDTGPSNKSAITAGKIAKIISGLPLVLLQSYWNLIKPCCYSDSTIRKRLDEGESTWSDLGVWFLASVFGFCVLVVVLRAYRAIMDQWPILEAVLWGMRYLLGV
jgi:hypothetical protein